MKKSLSQKKLKAIVFTDMADFTNISALAMQRGLLFYLPPVETMFPF